MSITVEQKAAVIAEHAREAGEQQPEDHQDRRGQGATEGVPEDHLAPRGGPRQVARPVAGDVDPAQSEAGHRHDEPADHGLRGTVTDGLDGLRDRLKEYYGLGARFAKWRGVIAISGALPTAYAIHANAHALARYAVLCQEQGIVPIVEPEVLMDGAHDIDRCFEVTELVLKTQFEELYFQRVALEGMVLKPNMAIAGKKAAKRAGVDEVAEKTVKLLKNCVPGAVPGIAFLSGGQSDEEATAHLDTMNKIGGLPWHLTFSYGRALQHAPQKAWSGKSENVAAAQRVFTHRAAMNGLASKGQWKQDLEKKAA